MSGLESGPAGVIASDGRLAPSTIVVPIDNTELARGALLIGRELAARFGAELVVIAVDEEHDRLDVPVPDVVGELGVIWRRVPRSTLVTAVVDLTAECPLAAVCVGTHARSPLVDTRDDLAQKVLRAVEVPVLMVGPHCRTESFDGPVVVAHDGSPGGHAAMRAARVWATALDVPSILLHVHQPLGEKPSEVMPTLLAAQRQLGGASLEMLASTFPAGAIREYVHEVDASLLAISTRGRTGTLTASTGRTGTWILRESPCPLLIAHPAALRES